MLYCEGCGTFDPPNYVESRKGHEFTGSDHHPACEGDCKWCPVPVPMLCGPVVDDPFWDAPKLPDDPNVLREALNKLKDAKLKDIKPWTP